MQRTLRFLLVLAMAVFLIGCGSGGGGEDGVDQLNQGLRAYYTFNGNANDSINGNNGTVTGATTTTDRKNIEAYAYSLDGTDNLITIPHHASHYGNGQNAITVSIWIKPGKIHYGEAINDASGFSLYQISPGVAFTIWHAANSGISAEYTTAELSLENWTHIVGTFDGSKVRMYLNGVLQDDRDLTNPIFDRSIAMVLGRENNNYWQGKVDDLRIYDRALSQQEVTNLYNR